MPPTLAPLNAPHLTDLNQPLLPTNASPLSPLPGFHPPLNFKRPAILPELNPRRLFPPDLWRSVGPSDGDWGDVVGEVDGDKVSLLKQPVTIGLGQDQGQGEVKFQYQGQDQGMARSRLRARLRL